MEIGNKIKQLRQIRGFTQEQLAGKIGVSAQSVSKWENAVSMPDITLLPALAGEFGVSIDELFDLTLEEKMRRIENRLDRDGELPSDVFSEYERFLTDALEREADKYKATSLIAHLYHHRMESDARRVRRYAEAAIMMSPEKKDCQWLLNMAAGQTVWDWNVANHSHLIDFYKSVIESDKTEPKTPMPYYYLIDNLLADARTEEVREYLDKMMAIPSHNPALIPTYRAYIELAEHNEAAADSIIEEGISAYSESSVFIFEAAQYYAAKAEYDKAIKLYERSFDLEEKTKPRFTDALEGIAIIYGILGDKEKQIEAYNRMLDCLMSEWNYSDEDLPVRELKTKIYEIK